MHYIKNKPYNYYEMSCKRIKQILSAFLCIICCGFLLNVPSALAADKAVAFYYDNSGSMTEPMERWIAANYSLQLLSSLVSQNDEIYVSSTSSPENTRRLSSTNEILDFLQLMQNEQSPESGTPYTGITTLLSALEQSQKTDKWLIAITDGEFESFTNQQLATDIEKARKLGVKANFILIERSGSSAVAREWSNGVGSETIQISRATQLPNKMEELAAKLTDRDADGLDVNINNNRVTVQSIFPLRSMVVITQGNQDVKVSNAFLQSNSGNRDLEKRQFDIKSVQENPNVHRYASVSHLNFENPIDLGDETAVVEFNGDAGKVDLAILPEVAARLDVSIYDESNKKVDKNAQGFYEICKDQHLVLHSKITDNNSNSLTSYANNLNNFDVGFEDSTGTLIQSNFNNNTQIFETTFTTNQTTFLNPYAKYRGYFNFQSDTINIQPVDCERDIKITNTTKVDNDRRWVRPLNELDNNDKIIFKVTLDGKPAKEQEMIKWQWEYDTEHWDMIATEGKVEFLPITNCCVFVWSRQQPHSQEFKLNVITANKYDTITLPNPMQYEWSEPAGLHKYWWLYGCPITALLSLLSFLWYLYRIIVVKQRFGRKAKVHIIQDGDETFEPLVRSKSLLKHWLWPSKVETKVVNGITFKAIGRGGHAILVAGKSLTQDHDVDEWMYDENAKEQANARLRDGSVIVKKGIQYNQPEYMLQYATSSTKANWPSNSFF